MTVTAWPSRISAVAARLASPTRAHGPSGSTTRGSAPVSMRTRAPSGNSSSNGVTSTRRSTSSQIVSRCKRPFFSSVRNAPRCSTVARTAMSPSVRVRSVPRRRTGPDSDESSARGVASATVRRAARSRKASTASVSAGTNNPTPCTAIPGSMWPRVTSPACAVSDSGAGSGARARASLGTRAPYRRPDAGR